MSTVTWSFELPMDADEYRAAQKGDSLLCAADDMATWLKWEWKAAEDKKEAELLEIFRAKFHELFGELMDD